MYSAASPVSQAVFAVQQAHAALVAAAIGGIHDDVPQAPEYPFVWNEVLDESDVRGLGTGGIPLIEFRTHVFSQFGGRAEAQELNRLIIGALKDQPLAITGYEQAGTVFYDNTISLSDEEIAGVKVHEIVSNFRIYAREL